MKICLIETVLYVEIQLFYEIDFSNLTLKKSVVFFKQFSYFCHIFVLRSEKPKFLDFKRSPGSLVFFSPVSRHLREAIKPHLVASQAKTLEGVTGVYHFSLNSSKNRKNLSWHEQNVETYHLFSRNLYPLFCGFICLLWSI